MGKHSVRCRRNRNDKTMIGINLDLNQSHSGCKVNSFFFRPDIVLLGENFGGNIDMTRDGHIGVEKAICEKNCIAQKKSTEK